MPVFPVGHGAAADLSNEVTPSQQQRGPCGIGQIHHAGQPHARAGEPREGLSSGSCLLGKCKPGQGSSLCPGLRVMLCSLRRQGRNQKPSSPPGCPWQICFDRLSSFLFNAASPPFQVFQSPLQMSPVIPTFTQVALPQIISTHFRKKNLKKKRSPSLPHPSLLIWSSLSTLAGTDSRQSPAEAKPGTCGRGEAAGQAGVLVPQAAWPGEPQFGTSVQLWRSQSLGGCS